MDSTGNPQIIILAGPNGAGKSTSAARLLRDTFAVEEFVNADVIAQGLSGFAPHGAALEAGKVMLRRLRTLAGEKKSFAFETTLSSRSFVPWLAGLKVERYRIHLFFLALPSPEMAIRRVADRVRLGGHHVPSDVVTRRYYSGLRNFFGLYLPVVTSWHLFDNSRLGQPLDVAESIGENEPRVYNDALFSLLKGFARHGC